MSAGLRRAASLLIDDDEPAQVLSLLPEPASFERAGCLRIPALLLAPLGVRRLRQSEELVLGDAECDWELLRFECRATSGGKVHLTLAHRRWGWQAILSFAVERIEQLSFRHTSSDDGIQFALTLRYAPRGRSVRTVQALFSVARITRRQEALDFMFRLANAAGMTRYRSVELEDQKSVGVELLGSPEQSQVAYRAKGRDPDIEDVPPTRLVAAQPPAEGELRAYGQSREPGKPKTTVKKAPKRPALRRLARSQAYLVLCWLVPAIGTALFSGQVGLVIFLCLAVGLCAAPAVQLKSWVAYFVLLVLCAVPATMLGPAVSLLLRGAAPKVAVVDAPRHADACCFEFHDGQVRTDYATTITGEKHRFTVAPVVPPGWSSEQSVPVWVGCDSESRYQECLARWEQPIRAGGPVEAPPYRYGSEYTRAIKAAEKKHQLRTQEGAPLIEWKAEPWDHIWGIFMVTWTFIGMAHLFTLLWWGVRAGWRALRGKPADWD